MKFHIFRYLSLMVLKDYGLPQDYGDYTIHLMHHDAIQNSHVNHDYDYGQDNHYEIVNSNMYL